MSRQVVGTCALCLQSGVRLLDSHILPKWTYRRARDRSGAAGSPDPILFRNGVVIQTSEQIREHLLCEVCEQLLSPDENYVSKLAFQEDESLGLERMLESGTSVPRALVGGLAFFGDSPRAALVSNLECVAIARFAASVFWRTAVARRQKFIALRLWKDQVEALRRFVRGEKGLPNRFCFTMMALVDNPGETPMRGLQGTSTMAPSTAKRGENSFHQFIAAGLLFCLGTGTFAHPEICLACSRRPHALFQEWHKARLAWDGMLAIVSGERKGKAARLG